MVFAEPTTVTSATPFKATASTTKTMNFSRESVFEKYSSAQASVQDIWSVGLGGGHDSTTGAVDNDFAFATNGSPYVDPMDNTSPSVGTISPNELLSTGTSVISSFEDFEQSPLFQGIDVTDEWAPLFETDNVKEKVVAPVIVQQAERDSMSPPIKAEACLSPVLTNSCVSKSRKGSEEEIYKKDSHGITAYNRKPRSAPLQPISLPEDGDSVAVKRAKNTEAARRSRARKLERMVQLEDRVDELLARNQDLEQEVKRLRLKCGEA